MLCRDDISTSPVRESSFLKLLNQASSPRTNPFGLGSDRTPQGLESAKKRLAMGAALFPSATEAPRESPDVSTGDFQATWDSVGQLADTYAEKKTVRLACCPLLQHTALCLALTRPLTPLVL